MSKKIVCILVVLATIQTAFAQHYAHSPNDSIVANAVFDDVSVYNITQTHSTNDTLFFKWKKLLVDMPATWEATICDVGHCYTSIVDSSSMDSVVVGDYGLISLHINPHFEAGTGTIQVLFWERNTPMLIDTLTWIISAKSNVGIHQFDAIKSISIFPNPTTDFIHLSTIFKDGFDYSIFDINGKIVTKGSAANSNASIHLPPIPKGQYTIAVKHNNQVNFTSFLIN